jgi:hypothetical protein
VLRAEELLRAGLAPGEAHTEGAVQYRGAWHPNKTGGGVHRGVEVWLSDGAQAPQAPPPPAVAPPPPPPPPPSSGDSERDAVLAEGERRGWPAAELDAAVQIESGWNPHAYAKSTNAGGLIGFMPFVLPMVGWRGTPEAFRAQGIRAQAPYVGRYFDVTKTKWRRPGDTYLALAAPGFVGRDDSVEVYPVGGKAWQLNPGWRGPDGRITVGSIRAVLFRKMARRAPPPRTTGQSFPLLLGAVLAGLYLWRCGKCRARLRRLVA